MTSFVLGKVCSSEKEKFTNKVIRTMLLEFFDVTYKSFSGRLF